MVNVRTIFKSLIVVADYKHEMRLSWVCKAFKTIYFRNIHEGKSKITKHYWTPSKKAKCLIKTQYQKLIESGIKRKLTIANWKMWYIIWGLERWWYRSINYNLWLVREKYNMKEFLVELKKFSLYIHIWSGCRTYNNVLKLTVFPIVPSIHTSLQ